MEARAVRSQKTMLSCGPRSSWDKPSSTGRVEDACLGAKFRVHMSKCHEAVHKGGTTAVLPGLAGDSVVSGSALLGAGPKFVSYPSGFKRVRKRGQRLISIVTARLASISKVFRSWERGR